MKKSYLIKLVMYLVIILSIIMMATTASAKTYYRTGECGPSANYNITAGLTLVISGTGKLYDYNWGTDTPWYGWSDEILSIEISNGITMIGEDSFAHLERVLSVSLPSTITKIKEWAFYHCDMLTELHVPEGCTTLEGNTFGYSGIKKLYLPATLTSIPYNCFKNMGKLTTIYFNGTKAQWETLLPSRFSIYRTDLDKSLVDVEIVFTKVDPIEAFVMRCYQVILNREVDTEGLTSWSTALRNGTAKASQIIDGIVRSQEYTKKNLSNKESVKVLYRAMLNREPDPAGLAAWTDVLNQGYPFGTVINGFCGSDEFKNLCAEYGIQPGSVKVGSVQPVTPTADMAKIKAFVTRCYSVILGREPDPDGLNAWANALATGKRKASEIIDGFVNSQEFLSKKLSKEEQVDILYQAMLGRGADPAGKASWVKVLNEGHPFGAVINGFCGSTEFINLCAEYGIQPGSVQVKAALVKRVSIAPEDSDPDASTVRIAYNSEYINEEKIRAFVMHCYESVLGREGDEEGVANYTVLILDGEKTPKRVAYEFIFSPEFQGKLPGNEELVRILYRLYLNREPGAEELAGWIEMLEGGAGLDDVVKGFAESTEFRTIMNSMKE